MRGADHDAGPHPRGRRAQRRRRDDPPAGRRVRRDRARSTSRRWCRSGSCRSRSACGNTFVLKPSEQVPLTQQIAFEVARRARPARRRRQPRQRRPRGRRGRSSTTPASTPSRSSARRRSRSSSTSAPPRAGKRVQALGGAKNHMVVMPDAVIDKTVERHHRLGLRRRRPALHGGLGRGHGRRGARAADRPRCARPPRRCGSATGSRRASTSARSSRAAARDRDARLRSKGAAAEGAEHRASTAARRAGDGRSSARRSSTASTPEMEVVARGDLRPGALDRARRHARRGDRARQRAALRQRHVDLHRVGRGGPALPPRGRGGHDRRQHRRRGARSPSSRSRAGRTRSSATCTPTAPTRSSSTRARRPSPAAGSRAARAAGAYFVES